MADRAVTLKIQIDSETYEVEATREEVQKLQRELNQSRRNAEKGLSPRERSHPLITPQMSQMKRSISA